MKTQFLKHWKLFALLLVCKALFAFGVGPEGTNTPYSLANFDVLIGKIKMPDIATGSTTGHKLLVKESVDGWVREMPLYTAGTGISVNGSNVVTNTAPDQTVTITAGFGTTVTGTYPNFTIAQAKKRETSSGTTNASGTYTFTFAQTYSVAPNVQANIINGTDSQIIRIGTPSTTSVTVTVRNRVDVIGLLPSWSNVSGASVDILVTEK